MRLVGKMKRRTLLASAAMVALGGCSSLNSEVPVVTSMDPEESPWFAEVRVSSIGGDRMKITAILEPKKCSEIRVGEITLTGPAGLVWERQRVEGGRCSSGRLKHHLESAQQPGEYAIELSANGTVIETLDITLDEESAL